MLQAIGIIRFEYNRKGLGNVEKRRVRLEINGIVVGIITEEDDEYMQEISNDVGKMMSKVMAASTFITREAAALTTALSYCDDSRRTYDRLQKMKKKAMEMERHSLEMERQAAAAKKENSQLWDETEALLNQPNEDFAVDEKIKLQQRIAELEAEVLKLRSKLPEEEVKDVIEPKLKNPLKQDDYDQQGFVSFFKKDD